jgi:hypothetical protein
MGMRDFALTIEEVRSLRALHRSCRDRRLADRIKAIVLLATGWTVSDTGEALMLDEQTVREYVQLYRRGTDKSLKSNTGRARVNINGAIDIDHLGIVVDFAESVNAQSSLRVLRTLESKHPEAEKIYVYCDSARYYRCSLVQEPVNRTSAV